uniref:RING-type domain-containing protein n=1 Tax=Mycena chlorophos TaxID=658473 RepID=A0ABQ0LVA4_MYCCL|nr:predicted protein [Mycena chlorophos]
MPRMAGFGPLVPHYRHRDAAAIAQRTKAHEHHSNTFTPPCLRRTHPYPPSLAELYVGKTRPPPITQETSSQLALPEHPEHLCGICKKIMSNPVKIPECPHTFCVVCLNEWLVQDNHCPECNENIFSRPRRDWETLKSIRQAYPTWQDTSVVIKAGFPYIIFPSEFRLVPKDAVHRLVRKPRQRRVQRKEESPEL